VRVRVRVLERLRFRLPASADSEFESIAICWSFTLFRLSSGGVMVRVRLRYLEDARFRLLISGDPELESIAIRCSLILFRLARIIANLSLRSLRSFSVAS